MIKHLKSWLPSVTPREQLHGISVVAGAHISAASSDLHGEKSLAAAAAAGSGGNGNDREEHRRDGGQDAGRSSGCCCCGR